MTLKELGRLSNFVVEKALKAYKACLPFPGTGLSKLIEKAEMFLYRKHFLYKQQLI